MTDEFFDVRFICDVCEQPTDNFITLNKRFGWTGKETTQDLGYVDSRHPVCEQLHGSFKAMTDDLSKIMSPQEAEDFVKAHRKISIVASKLAKHPKLAGFTGNVDMPQLQQVVETAQAERRAELNDKMKNE